MIHGAVCGLDKSCCSLIAEGGKVFLLLKESMKFFGRQPIVSVGSLQFH